MNKTTSHGAWPLRVAALAAMLALGACGGGKDDAAGQPWMQPAAAPAAAERASAPRTTLAAYAVEREGLAVVQGFPSPTEEELASIHRRSVERGIAQLLPQLGNGYITDTGNGLALPSLQSSWRSCAGTSPKRTATTPAWCRPRGCSARSGHPRARRWMVRSCARPT